jgi:hypothetical protein
VSEERRTVTEKIKAIGGTLTAVTGAIAAITQLTGALPTALSGLSGLSLGAWWFLSLILILLGAGWVWDGLSSRSRLIHVEAMYLRPDDSRYLVGRTDDVDALISTCRESALVYLVGESGAGKTALIQAGVLPRLTSDSSLLPIYLNSYGHDWEAGPRVTLLHTVKSSVPANIISGSVSLIRDTAVSLVRVIEELQNKVDKTFLIIFDQFDDYQTRHRQRFLLENTHVWPSVASLMTTNAFWRDIDQLLRVGCIQCMFVTRDDSADGLESVRFSEPKIYRLDRVKKQFLSGLLDDLTSAKDGRVVVSNPDRGWNRLKPRLIRDLAHDGFVLPAQLKIVLEGLGTLGSLTVREYERSGGLHGLEAAHVQEAITTASRQSRLDKVLVHQVLLRLIDAKTTPQTTRDLASFIGADVDKTSAALGLLERNDLIRMRADLDTKTEAWQLDHDYLCEAVFEVERRWNRWRSTLSQAYESYQNAGRSIWRRWKALLPLRLQVALLVQRIRGSGFRYGKMRGFALVSLFRLIQALLILCLLWVVAGLMVAGQEIGTFAKIVESATCNFNLDAAERKLGVVQADLAKCEGKPINEIESRYSFDYVETRMSANPSSTPQPSVIIGSPVPPK